VAAVPGEFTKEAADEAEEDKTWWGVCGSLLRSLRTKRGYAFFEVRREESAVYHITWHRPS
jgi:hypothetical protein